MPVLPGAVAVLHQIRIGRMQHLEIPIVGVTEGREPLPVAGGSRQGGQDGVGQGSLPFVRPGQRGSPTSAAPRKRRAFLVADPASINSAAANRTCLRRVGSCRRQPATIGILHGPEIAHGAPNVSGHAVCT
jgi:hypothetical protein